MSCILSALHCVSLRAPSLLWCSPKATDQLMSKRSFTQRKISTMQHSSLPSGRICAIKSPSFLYMSHLNRCICCLPFSCPTCRMGRCSRNILPSLFPYASHFFSYFTEPFSLHVIGSNNSSESCFSSILLNMLAFQYLINDTCGSWVTKSFIL